MTLVLTPEELACLTGYKQPARQAKWLKANGFKFRLNRVYDRRDLIKVTPLA